MRSLVAIFVLARLHSLTISRSSIHRWRRIYDNEADDVNKVQKDIREGHAKTIDIALQWLESGGVAGTTICDCGCGTGSLTVPLALSGAEVTASDISSAMVEETRSR